MGLEATHNKDMNHLECKRQLDIKSYKRFEEFANRQKLRAKTSSLEGGMQS